MLAALWRRLVGAKSRQRQAEHENGEWDTDGINTLIVCGEMLGTGLYGDGVNGGWVIMYSQGSPLSPEIWSALASLVVDYDDIYDIEESEIEKHAERWMLLDEQGVALAKEIYEVVGESFKVEYFSEATGKVTRVSQ